MKKQIMFGLCSFLYCSAWASSQEAGLLPINNPIMHLNAPTNPLTQKLPMTLTLVNSGGYGGNEGIGAFIYAGMQNTLPYLTVSRDENISICYLKNKNVVIKNDNTNEIITFNCYNPNPNRNNLYWDADLGAVNGGFSPENDALYAADTVTNMFVQWYGIPPLKDKNGLQQPIILRLHNQMDNSVFYYNNEIVIGDGVNIFYPLTSLSAISYMIGGVFTQQNANLNFNSESGGIDVAFNCITAMAAEFYVTGKNTWQIGAEIAKKGKPLHFIDIPSKSCDGKKPGDNCDIDTLAQYKKSMLGYYSSGLFNRAFYLLATTNGWNTHKAYDVFVRANRFHWKPNTNFHSGACGVVASAVEIGYDAMSVMKAFSGVGIDTRDC